jgi:hypothetical protein
MSAPIPRPAVRHRLAGDQEQDPIMNMQKKTNQRPA